MPTFHNDILGKLELATQTFLAAAGLTLTDAANIHCGFAKDDRACPFIVAVARDAEIDVNFDGNWSCDLEIMVASNVDDTTRAQHEERAGEAFSYFFTATIAADLSAAIDDFTVQEFLPRRQSKDLDDRKWIHRAMFKVNCCGSDLG